MVLIIIFKKTKNHQTNHAITPNQTKDRDYFLRYPFFPSSNSPLCCPSPFFLQIHGAQDHPS